MNYIDPFIQEFQQEANATKRCLAALPESKFDWKPHEKSMSLGALASHIAEAPQWGISVLKQDSFDMDPATYKPWLAGSGEELMAKFEETKAALLAAMDGATNDELVAMWKFSINGEVKMQAPRAAMLHGMIMNHLYHHRGQLTVYMRLLGIPVPSVYGPTADEPN